MRHRHFFCLSIIILPVCLFSALLAAHPIEDEKPLSSNIDFAGVEKFLELTAILEKDKEPTQEQWDEMFATPGYAILILREFNKNFFVERIRLAFMPSKKEALEAKMKEEKGFWAQFLPHYVRAKNQRKLIEEQVAKLKASDFMEAAVEESRKFLPDLPIEEYPPLSFVIFGPDARGYMPVVVDVLYAYDQEDFLLSFLAHEFHHYYRNQLFTFAQDQSIIWVIDQIQGEGIADQINRGKWFHDKNLYPRYAEKNSRFLDSYAKSPEIIRKMNFLFEAAYDHPEKKMAYGQQLQAVVPMSGHPTGFYMANLILEQLGKDALVKDIGNPFAFFRLYKQAADRKGKDTPTFSEKTIRFIRSLEERYIR
jgi:uncharacterized protein YjaZ